MKSSTAALQEDAHAVCISSYQGGHLEYFGYLVEQLRVRGGGHIRVYGGGGGVIAPDEIDRLHALGVARIFSPEDGRRLGLEGMIRQIVVESAQRPPTDAMAELARLAPEAPVAVARLVSWLEEHGSDTSADLARVRDALAARRPRTPAPIVGFTGTGGAGKSSVVDEVLRRLRRDHPELAIGCLLVDPTRRRTGGALLGDRIRMNAVMDPRIYVRSLATRQAHRALSQAVRDAIAVLQAADFDLVLVETAGIGQSDSEITELADLSIYVMTPEYGAPSQLEKIDMLDLADFVVLNKSDRHGAADALRDVRKQWRRNRTAFDAPDEAVPVFATIASRFGDAGTERFYRALVADLAKRAGEPFAVTATSPPAAVDTQPLVPSSRRRYLAEIAETVRGYRARSDAEAERASDAWALERALHTLDDAEPATSRALRARRDAALATLPEDRAQRARGLARAAGTLRGGDPELRGPRAADPGRQPCRDAGRLEGAARRSAGDRRVGSRTALPATRERARRIPVHRRRVPVQARGRRADPDVRGRGHARANQPPLPSARGGAGDRAALDRLRQRHALWPRSAPATRHLGQGRQLRRVGLHGRRRQEALFGLRPLRSEDLRLDDDQRARADDPRVLPARGDRPAGGEAPARGRATRRRASPLRDRCPYTPAICLPITTDSASGCSASPAARLSMPRPTRASAPTCCSACVARCRPTS